MGPIRCAFCINGFHKYEMEACMQGPCDPNHVSLNVCAKVALWPQQDLRMAMQDTGDLESGTGLYL